MITPTLFITLAPELEQRLEAVGYQYHGTGIGVDGEIRHMVSHGRRQYELTGNEVRKLVKRLETKRDTRQNHKAPPVVCKVCGELATHPTNQLCWYDYQWLMKYGKLREVKK